MEAKRSTICLIYNPCHRLKVAEGCTKKSTSQSSVYTPEIDRKSLLILTKMDYNNNTSRFKLTSSKRDQRRVLFVPQGVVTTDFCLFFLISHMASQSWTICDTCVGFKLLDNNDWALQSFSYLQLPLL